MVGRVLYLNGPLLTILSADRQTSVEYNKLIMRTTGALKVLEVQNRALRVEESSIANTMLFDRVTPVGHK